MIFHLTSKKPVLIIGNGFCFENSRKTIQDFINKTHIPVLTTMNGVDLVQGEYHLGFIGTYGNRVANMIISSCDLIISIGARLGLRQIGHDNKLFAPNAKLIRVDIDQNELSRTIKEDEEDYCMDAKSFLDLLMNEPIPNYSKWMKACIEARELLLNYDDVDGNICIKKINELIPENSIVAVDVGQNQCWAAQSLNISGTNSRILIAGGYGSMGCGLPFAIGASFSKKNMPIFCITGDGGLQMNIQELEVLHRDKLPIKIFVLNNRALGKISEIQAKSYNGRFAQTNLKSGYSTPNFVKIGEAYEIRSVSINSFDDFKKYKDWFVDLEPTLFDIYLPEGTLLIPKISWDNGAVKPDLDLELQQKIQELIG